MRFEEGSEFITLHKEVNLDDILCMKEQRVVGNDNCVSYKGICSQIPPVSDRNHFVRARVMVHEHSDGRMSVFHGSDRLLTTELTNRLPWFRLTCEGRSMLLFRLRICLLIMESVWLWTIQIQRNQT